MSDGATTATPRPASIEAEPESAAAVFGERLPTARQYARLLVDVAIPRGLLGPRESERIWSRHLVNSAALAEAMPDGAQSVIDVGSGAGLPGIPLALARPDLRVTLLEPMLRRAEFLAECIDALGLDVAVVRARAQDYVGPRVDVAVVRAVAPLERLLAMAPHVIHPAGALLALKGKAVHDEMAAASRYATADGVTLETLAMSANPEGVVVRATWNGAGTRRTHRGHR